MDILFTGQIARALSARCSADVAVSNVVIDSRKVCAGSLFVAIKGERFDGHDFIPDVIKNGAAAVMVSRQVETPEGVAVITVDDTAKGLLQMAAYYRRRFKIPVVGVTGSVGKTTTKEMIHTVLSQKYNTLKTAGNLNNNIGLPMTVFGLDSNVDAAILEMGMSNFGEIRTLTEVAAPTIGVITCIGVSHIQNLGTREGILKAKLEILEGMEKGSPLVIGGDNDMLRNLEPADHRVIRAGAENPENDYLAEDIHDDGVNTSFTVRFGGKRQGVTIPAIGVHNVQNAVVAFAVGMECGVSPEAAAYGLSRYKPTGMRQHMVDKNGIHVIEDCYNASPDSMRAAISALAAVHAGGRRVAVLGDMLELGDISEEAHYEVGRFAAENNIDLLLAYGEYAQQYIEGARAGGLWGAWPCDSKKVMAETLANGLRAGDTVLFKASRGVKLEEAIAKLYDLWENKK